MNTEVTEKELMDVAVIIVNYKMAEYIRQCLASLALDMRDTTLKMRVVLVDNASKDHMADVIAQSPCVSYSTIIYLQKNYGYAAGVNAGIATIAARYYLIINPDIVFFEKDTVMRLVRYMDTHSYIGIAGPKLIYPDGSLQYSCWRFPSFFTPLFRRTRWGETKRGEKILSHFLMQDFNHGRMQPVDCVMGSAMMVRESALQKVAGMCEDYFMYFEDIDWCRRFWQHHIPVYYIPDVRLRHELRRDSARVEGFKALFLNPMARVHVKSWLRYFWKWRI